MIRCSFLSPEKEINLHDVQNKIKKCIEIKDRILEKEKKNSH